MTIDLAYLVAARRPVAATRESRLPTPRVAAADRRQPKKLFCRDPTSCRESSDSAFLANCMEFTTGTAIGERRGLVKWTTASLESQASAISSNWLRRWKFELCFGWDLVGCPNGRPIAGSCPPKARASCRVACQSLPSRQISFVQSLDCSGQVPRALGLPEAPRTAFPY